VEIRAHHSAVAATELCTVLGDPRGGSVATVEHLLAALSGLGVDNATIEIDGPEVPVMDGSAQPFVEAVRRAGIVVQRAPKRFIKVRRPVRVDLGSAFAEFRPHDGRRFEVAIAFDCPVIGKQSYAVELTPKRFRREIAGARTFGYMKDVERLWAAGYALGSSLENSVAIGEGGVMNPEGLRYPDEFARHKLLDAIGDIALAGTPILGLYRSYKGGHKLNAMALAALMAQPDAWTVVSAATDREARPEPLKGVLAPAFAELA
jgi:UDP-3-O-[3-hydroxymyristoyl] N-acetylglucosamine deacetylase